MQFSVNLFGRTAVRPYKNSMILNGITDQEDWLLALPIFLAQKRQHHFLRSNLTSQHSPAAAVSEDH